MRELNNMVKQICEGVLDEYEYDYDFADLLKAIAAGLRVGYCLSDKEKKIKGRRILGECQKVPEEWQGFAPYDFLITFYEPNIAGMNDEQLHILAYHELMHVGVEIQDDGDFRIWIRPHDLEDFNAVLAKFGAYWAK